MRRVRRDEGVRALRWEEGGKVGAYARPLRPWREPKANVDSRLRSRRTICRRRIIATETSEDRMRTFSALLTSQEFAAGAPQVGLHGCISTSPDSRYIV